MRRRLAIPVFAALALFAAAPAFASFRIRIPGRAAALRAPARSRPGAPANAAAIPAFPEGSLMASYGIPGGDASFALYWCGLAPHEALEAASAALAAAGWIRVSVFGTLALFENSAGNCAAAQSLPAQGGASAVSILVGGRR